MHGVIHYGSYLIMTPEACTFNKLTTSSSYHNNVFR